MTQWRDTNERLVAANGQLDAANQQIIEKGEYIQALVNSRSTVGIAFTCAIKKISWQKLIYK
jgi:hypothetical protein